MCACVRMRAHIDSRASEKFSIDLHKNNRLDLLVAGPGVLDVPSPDVGLDVKFGFNDLCPVCGDKVSGFHYGLLTCESCKGKTRQASLRLPPQRLASSRLLQTNSTEQKELPMYR